MGTTLSADAIGTPPTADAGGPYSGEVGVPVDFDGTAFEGDSPIEEYYWDFGDGSSATVEDPSHTYLTGGTFEVCFAVIDISGFGGGDCTFAVISDNTSNLSCGPGTIENDNQCVPTYAQITCGFGTILDGNECVQDPTVTQQLSDLQGELTTCNESLATCSEDLLFCQGDLSDANEIITQLQSQLITEGCEKGYWKNSKHFDQWSEAGIDPNAEFLAPFPPFVFSQGFFGPTYIEVLNINNQTPNEKFAKEFITSGLNLLHPDIDYPLTEEDILEITAQAFQNNDPDEILAGAAQLEHYNTMFCPLEASTIIPPQSEPICGDGNLDAGEQCDDGNLDDTDSCSNSCTVNPAPVSYHGDWELDPHVTTQCEINIGGNWFAAPDLFTLDQFNIEDSIVPGEDLMTVNFIGIDLPPIEIPDFGQDGVLIANTANFHLEWNLFFDPVLQDRFTSQFDMTNIHFPAQGALPETRCDDIHQQTNGFLISQ